jgi:RHS repeat-associated protein
VGQRLTDAFGNQISSSGVWKGRFAYGGPYGYQEDPDTGLRLLGHRYYDSSTGRFLTRDPIKDGRNWYLYCDNNPTTRIDDSGLKYHDPVQVIVDPDMDVDFLIIILKDGSVLFYFLPGKSTDFDGKVVPSTYRIGKNGIPYPVDGGAPANRASPSSFFSRMQVWWNWLRDASKTGFPKGYEPQRTNPYGFSVPPGTPLYWPDIFKGW